MEVSLPNAVYLIMVLPRGNEAAVVDRGGWVRRWRAWRPVADVQEIHFVGAKGLRCIGAYGTGQSGDKIAKDVNDIGWITQRTVIGGNDLKWSGGPDGPKRAFDSKGTLFPCCLCQPLRPPKRQPLAVTTSLRQRTRSNTELTPRAPLSLNLFQHIPAEPSPPPLETRRSEANQRQTAPGSCDNPDTPDLLYSYFVHYLGTYTILQRTPPKLRLD
ncbi:uncharacterized protein CLUP02_07055 [Colletotrichum lupini]|uniref:Uncharacterized protein n=1 Tax=Colletotrichum lupini TaxID=145971 RepID=A0A9Q8SQ97_9PEZI|nr:uncharacterized protein CLUP02_07055 [Colletotrichum lupini]UQC81569.1 hypothetical protein CLUP02_07055 [Colletotrichum lupini]